MIEPIGFFIGSPSELPMYEIVQRLFEEHYGKMNGCARSKCLLPFGGKAISPPNCTSVYKKKKEENNGIYKM